MKTQAELASSCGAVWGLERSRDKRRQKRDSWRPGQTKPNSLGNFYVFRRLASQSTYTQSQSEWAGEVPGPVLRESQHRVWNFGVRIFNLVRIVACKIKHPTASSPELHQNSGLHEHSKQPGLQDSGNEKSGASAIVSVAFAAPNHRRNSAERKIPNIRTISGGTDWTLPYTSNWSASSLPVFIAAPLDTGQTSMARIEVSITNGMVNDILPSDGEERPLEQEYYRQGLNGLNILRWEVGLRLAQGKSLQSRRSHVVVGACRAGKEDAKLRDRSRGSRSAAPCICPKKVECAKPRNLISRVGIAVNHWSSRSDEMPQMTNRSSRRKHDERNKNELSTSAASILGSLSEENFQDRELQGMGGLNNEGDRGEGAASLRA
ncbi:hypothetical protein C8R47DRAFT_1069179 [Mycena vitilis]|nr:hypothetical protein C8R47DRAFT_1069179 [Mycena vitilis]